MTFQYIGNDRYKIYLDRIPSRSIRLSIDEINEINEIAENNPTVIQQKDDIEKLQIYYDDVLGDIEEQLGLFREAEELIKNIKNDTVRSEIADILEALQNQVSGHI